MKRISILITLLFFTAGKLITAQPTNYWTKIYNTQNNGLDKAVAVTTDANCNVYVTGVSEGISTGMDYLTIKYDVDGNIVWYKSYDGGASGDDQPAAIAVDLNGNVYVTGKSTGTGTGYDYATIKYDAGGNVVWTKRFNNTNTGGNQDDIATCLVVDAGGLNVYVGGSSYNYISSNSNNDVVVLRYDAATGNPNWANPAFGNALYNEQVAAIAVDGAGIVYGAGSFSTNTYTDWYLFTVDVTGVLHNGGCCAATGATTDLTLDGSGNIYVIGENQDNNVQGGITVIKCTPSFSNYAWRQYFNVYTLGINQGLGEFNTKASKIRINNSGVYVNGNFDIDAGTNSYNYDTWTAKLSLATGDTIWTKRLGSSGDDKTSSLALDVSGNAYTTGYYTNGGNKDLFINKYVTNSNGTVTVSSLPTTPYNGTAGADDAGSQIVVTPEKNIIVTGYTTGSNSQEDFITFKYVSFTPPTPVITQTGNTLHSDAVSGNQWYNGNTLISGAMGQTYTPTQNGTYHVVVTSGCYVTAPSNDLTLTHVGINEISITNFTITPNPSSGQIALSFETEKAEEVQIKIFDVLGQLIKEMAPENVNGLYTKPIDLGAIPQGVYLLQVKAGDKTLNKQLEIIH